MEEKRTQGPELGAQTRLDIVEETPGRYRLDMVNVAAEVPISEPHSRKDLMRIIGKLSGALRKASAHERDPEEEWANLKRFIAEIDEAYAKPDYPREFIVADVKELREDLAKAINERNAARGSEARWQALASSGEAEAEEALYEALEQRDTLQDSYRAENEVRARAEHRAERAERLLAEHQRDVAGALEREYDLATEEAAAFLEAHGRDEDYEYEIAVDAGGWNTSADVPDPDKLATALRAGAHKPG